jgi:hypothetical protein
MDTPTFYQIRVRGHLDEALASWFEDLTISDLEEGDSLITGYIPDQAALQGTLNRITKLGLTLVSVNSVPQDS